MGRNGDSFSKDPLFPASAIVLGDVWLDGVWLDGWMGVKMTANESEPLDAPQAPLPGKPRIGFRL